MSNRRGNIIRTLIERDGNHCAICGEEYEPQNFNIEHLTPKSQGGADGLENLILVCQRCNARLGQETRFVREFEFVSYLRTLLENSSEFHNINSEVAAKSGGFRADITAEEIVDNRLQPVAIECKALGSYTVHRANEVLAQILEYRKKMDGVRFIFAFPGEMTKESLSAFDKADIKIWDQEYIAERFQKQIKELQHPILQPMFLGALLRKKKSPEEELIDQLRACQPSRSDWLVYQQLVGRILEKLFCPPLQTPISEHSDASGVNRRDFILPNYAESGFWAFLRSRYAADYIVVDAKNYTGKIKKKEVLQIANYLKPHGAGLFAMIICRGGGDTSCIHTLREVWAIYHKLIIVLNDIDIEQMLLSAKSGNPPESIIQQKIEEFRLAL
jgi:hypothetical protein